MPGSFLSREDIVETTGVERLEELAELEILFLTFKEISALQYCPNLRRLSLIDNGLERVTNLAPVSMTLKTLCLCDQALTTVDNLELPQLRELFLHRNNLTSIGSLSRCPRIQRLWIFQNSLPSLSFVAGLAELQECWAQCNSISSLNALAQCTSLSSLNVAANPIDDLNEVKHLAGLGRLKTLCFNDIHFGRCGIVDEDGYRNYIVLLLRQVATLDGVQIKREQLQQAENDYYAQVQAFNDSLKDIEDSYQKSLRAIDQQHQSREAYSQVLEKEMTAALSELQVLVGEGRHVIDKEVSALLQLGDANLASLQSSLDHITHRATSQVQSMVKVFGQQYQEGIKLLALAEAVQVLHSRVIHTLTTAKTKRVNGLAFSVVNASSADFLMCASVIDPDILNTSNMASPSKASHPSSRRGAGESGEELFQLELAKLYKVVLPDGRVRRPQDEARLMYAVLGIEELAALLIGGWTAVRRVNERPAMLFSTNPTLLATLCSPLLDSMGSVRDSRPAADKKRDPVAVRPALLLCCEVSIARAGVQTQPGSGVLTLSLPGSDSQRQGLLESVYGTATAGQATQSFLCSNLASSLPSSSSPNAFIHSIPLALCDQAVAVDHLALCVQYLTGTRSERTGTLKSLEAKLEMLFLPTHHVQATGQLVSKFESEAASLVENYMQRMLEEVDELQAQTFQKAEKEVQIREQALRSTREEIEAERRVQENQLRELRSMTAGASANTGGGGNAPSSGGKLSSRR